MVNWFNYVILRMSEIRTSDPFLQSAIVRSIYCDSNMALDHCSFQSHCCQSLPSPPVQWVLAARGHGYIQSVSKVAYIKATDLIKAPLTTANRSNTAQVPQIVSNTAKSSDGEESNVM